ncbi:hypothetical protein B0H13DRAFT_1882308 [Mycena leptocephala]|nr:hypothetical protein B0H13DRAFT_1882308 [Mycena leptocephala]
MVLFASTFLILACWAALISAAPVHKVKKDCTLMTDAQFATCLFLLLQTSGHTHLTPLMDKPSLITETTRTRLSSTIQLYGLIDQSLLRIDNIQPQARRTGEICDDLATGTVWVEYDDRVDGHFKWNYLFEDLLSTEDRAVD